MMNKTFLQGRLVADPDLRHTPSGKAVASFRIAVDRDFKDRETGEKKADFINIVAWGNKAEFISRFFTKGRMIVIVGRLQMRDYNDRDGNRRTAAEVIVEEAYFGDSAKENQNSHSNYAPESGGYNYSPDAEDYAELQDEDGELPF
jgi:single-strand DNA-binding protein